MSPGGTDRAEFEPLAFPEARYVGGYSEYEKYRTPKRSWGRCYLNLTGTKIVVLSGDLRGDSDISYDDISSIELLTSDQVAKSKVLPVLVFGVFGGLAAKGSHDRVALAVRLKAGETAYFELFGGSFIQINARLEHFLGKVGIPLIAQPASTAQSAMPSVADEIQKLASLRDAGVITPEDFEKGKDK